MVSTAAMESSIGTSNTSGTVKSKVVPPPLPPVHILTSDPQALLDSVDHHARLMAEANSEGDDDAVVPREFSAVSYLNHHFPTESSLSAHLPALREAVAEAVASQSARLSATLVSSSSHNHSHNMNSHGHDIDGAIRPPSAAVHALAERVSVVRRKALQSEAAVREITRDMARLDCAKAHLQSAIVALKRLHMVHHAMATLERTLGMSPSSTKKMMTTTTTAATATTTTTTPSSNQSSGGNDDDEGNGGTVESTSNSVVQENDAWQFREAAHLVEALRELLGHFAGYRHTVEAVASLQRRFGVLRTELLRRIVAGYRTAGGVDVTLPFDGDEITGGGVAGAGAGAGADGVAGEILLPLSALAEACLVVDALGMDTRKRFLQGFCQDHVGRPYPALFAPANTVNVKKATQSKKSFKIALGRDDGNASNHNNAEKEVYSLDQVDRRFAWYRRLLRTLEERFGDVFPYVWQVHYHLTEQFLDITHAHFLALLSGPCRDLEADDVAVLLKALQKTILFEKEMMAWLVREHKLLVAAPAPEPKQPNQNRRLGRSNDDKFDTKPPSSKGTKGSSSTKDASAANDDEALEFDEEGNAVAAGSARGIRIRYERRMKEKQKQERRGDTDNNNHHHNAKDHAGVESEPPTINTDDPDDDFHRSDQVQAKINRPMPSLLGRASSAFDEPKYMAPYLLLEKETLESQLSSVTEDDTVDARGELPVFTSSTALFVTIKNSVHRSTTLLGLHRGEAITFKKLHQVYDRSLTRYAECLHRKLPKPVVVSSNTTTTPSLSSSLSSPDLSNSTDYYALSTSAALSDHTYVVSEGREVILCYVITTCEYCADTVEALEDRIRGELGGGDNAAAENDDDDSRRQKVDLSVCREKFYDVSASALKALVGGLEHRIEALWTVKNMVPPPSALSSSMGGDPGSTGVGGGNGDNATSSTGVGVSSSNNVWATLESVGDGGESPYVEDVGQEIRRYFGEVCGRLPSGYYRTACDRFVSQYFFRAFRRAILRLRRLGVAGAQQLLLDLVTLKAVTMTLPLGIMSSTPSSYSSYASAGAGASTSGLHGAGTGSHKMLPPASYVEAVNVESSKVERLLKLVATPPELLVDVAKSSGALLERRRGGTGTGGAASSLSLSKQQSKDQDDAEILSMAMFLKGMKRSDQQKVLEELGLKLDAKKVGYRPTGGSQPPPLASSSSSSSTTTSSSPHPQALWKASADKLKAAPTAAVDLSHQMRQKVDDFRKQFR